MQWLSEEIGDKLVETEETYLVNGTGTNQSKGLLTYPRSTDPDKTRTFGTLQKMVAAIATAIAADELIDFRAKLRKNAVWVMDSNTAANLQKLKNADGDYIWRDALKAGDPDTLLGRPVVYVETMPDISGGVAPIAFGDFKRGYYIIDHETGVRIRRQHHRNRFLQGVHRQIPRRWCGGFQCH